MRLAVRNQLINQVPEIEERCFEPHAAEAQTEKPYLVIRQGVDTEDSTWAGFRRIIEVWPYLARTSFTEVDALADKVVLALKEQLLTTEAGEAFSCLYLGTVGEDVVDPEWDIITRGLRFAVIALQPVSIEETVNNDPWLQALGAWTGEQLGEDWTVYSNLWPLGYIRPSIMWRLVTVEVEPNGPRTFEVRKRFAGHVLGTTPNQEISGITTVIEALGNAIKIPLEVEAKRYLKVTKPRGDYKADKLRNGQISLELSRLTNRPTLDIPNIGEFGISGNIE